MKKYKIVKMGSDVEMRGKKKRKVPDVEKFKGKKRINSIEELSAPSTSNRVLRSRSQSVLSMSSVSSCSSDSSDIGNLDVTVVDSVGSKSMKESVNKDSDGYSTNNVLKKRMKLIEAITSLSSTYKGLIVKEEQQKFEADVCGLLNVALEMVDTVVENSGYNKTYMELMRSQVAQSAVSAKVAVEDTSDSACGDKSVLQGSSFPSLPTVRKTYAVVLSSDNANKDSKEIETVFRKVVHPGAGKARINSVTALPNGQVRIVVPTRLERDNIQKRANVESGLKATVTERLGPRIVAYGVDLETQVESLLKDIYTHEFEGIKGLDEFEKSLKVVRRINVKQGKAL